MNLSKSTGTLLAFVVEFTTSKQNLFKSDHNDLTTVIISHIYLIITTATISTVITNVSIIINIIG